MSRVSLLSACAVATLMVLSGCKKEAAFQRAAPEVGTKLKDQQKFEMEMTMTMSGMGEAPASTEVSRVESTVVNKEVLAVENGAPTKMKVTYESKTASAKEQGQERKMDSPLVGKTFIAQVKEGKIDVTDEQGAPVDGISTQEVRRDTNDLGHADQFVVTMPDRVLKVGDEVPELARLIEGELIRSAGPQASKPEIKSVSVKLRETKDGVALFDVALSLTQAQGPTSMKTDLTGTMGVRSKDSRPVQLTLTGPVEIAMLGGNAPMKMEGKGKMTLDRRVSWQ